MKLSIKATCLSAFLFPGSGQFFLKCYLRGIIFMAIAGVGLYLIMATAFTIALAIANDIQMGNIPLGIASIREVIRQAMDVYKEPSLINAKIAIIGAWAVSSIDAYIEGKKKEKIMQGNEKA